MVNPKRSGSRPTPTEPDRDRGRSSTPDAAGSGFRVADTVAAVMLLLATLTYLGRLMLGLSQPGDTITPRDFGSLLAAIIAIVAGILLVTGVRPPVGRLTGALGAGALLLFNVANLTGGAVDDVLGKTDRWAAIPVVVTTFLAIVALLQASWSSVDGAGSRADREAYEEPDDVAQAGSAAAAPERSAPEPLGVIGAGDSHDEPVVPWQQSEEYESPLSPPAPGWQAEEFAEPPSARSEPSRPAAGFEPQLSLPRQEAGSFAESPLPQGHSGSFVEPMRAREQQFGSFAQRAEPESHAQRGEAEPYGQRGEAGSYGQQPEPVAFGLRGQTGAFGQQPESVAFGQRGDADAFGQRPEPYAQRGEPETHGQQPIPDAFGHRAETGSYGRRPEPEAYAQRPGAYGQGAEPEFAPERPATSVLPPHQPGPFGGPRTDEPTAPWQQREEFTEPPRPQSLPMRQADQPPPSAFERQAEQSGLSQPAPGSQAGESALPQGRQGSFAEAARTPDGPFGSYAQPGDAPEGSTPPQRPGPFGAPLNEGPAATEAFGSPRLPDPGHFAPEPQTARSREAESFAGQELPSPLSRLGDERSGSETQPRTEPFISQPPHIETESAEGAATSLLPRPTGPFGAPRREPVTPPEPEYGPGVPERYAGWPSNQGASVPERRGPGAPSAADANRREAESAAEQARPLGDPRGYEYAETEGIPVATDHPTTVLPVPNRAADDRNEPHDGVIGAQPFGSPETAPLNRADYAPEFADPRPPADDRQPNPHAEPAFERPVEYARQSPESAGRSEDVPAWAAFEPDPRRHEDVPAQRSFAAFEPPSFESTAFEPVDQGAQSHPPAEPMSPQQSNYAGRLPAAGPQGPADAQAHSSFEPADDRPDEGLAQQPGEYPSAPETAPIPGPRRGRQPVLRQPGGFLAPPPVDSEPIPAQQPPASAAPPPARHRGPDDQPYSDPTATHVDSAPPPPKRLSPMPWNDQQ